MNCHFVSCLILKIYKKYLWNTSQIRRCRFARNFKYMCIFRNLAPRPSSVPQKTFQIPLLSQYISQIFEKRRLPIPKLAHYHFLNTWHWYYYDTTNSTEKDILYQFYWRLVYFKLLGTQHPSLSKVLGTLSIYRSLLP